MRAKIFFNHKQIKYQFKVFIYIIFLIPLSVCFIINIYGYCSTCKW